MSRFENVVKCLCCLVGCLSLTGAYAELLTFTPQVTSSGQYTWGSKENWLTESGANKAPEEDDDLLIDTPAKQYHAANSTVYVKSIRFTQNALPYSGVSWNGFYLKSGGAGLKVEHTDSKTCYSTLYLDGDVTIDLAGGQTWEGVQGHSATQKGRITKIGAATLAFGTVKNEFWTGATIREGTLKLNTDNGKSGIDFHFDGTAENAWLLLGGNVTLKDGALTSTEDLPTTNHGVTDNSANLTLAVTGTPKTNDMYFAGVFVGTTSFSFAPSSAGYTCTVARAASTTIGRLGVSKGTLRLADGASFPSILSLSVSSGGVLELAADRGLVMPFDVTIDDEGSAISIGAGDVWSVARVLLNGEVLPEGDYTAASCAWVTGGGTVRIDHSAKFVNPITLDVTSEMTLEDALTAFNAANAGEAVTCASLNGGADAERTLVKKGTGTLRMNAALANFTGMVSVEAGILASEVKYSLGKESNPLSPIYVHSGATLSCVTTNANLNNGRTLHVSGTGADGQPGALVCESCKVSGNYHLSNVFGDHLVLDGDATVRVGSWVELAARATLNGHTLTVVGINGNNNDSPFHLRTIEDAGHIIVKNAEWRQEPPTTFNVTTPGNTVTFKNRGGFRFTTSGAFSGNFKNWSFIFDGPNSVFYTDYHISSRDSGVNRLTIPTEVNTDVSLVYQGDRRRGVLYVPTALSGTGGFCTKDARTVFLHLMNAANSFSGGLSFERGTIWAYPNGSIPTTGTVTLKPASATYNTTSSSNASANFQNYFDGIVFMCPDAYELPELVAQGTFPSRIQNGQGAWKKVTQKGAGLEYYSELGAPLLDVQKGYVKLPRAPAAGLWEGTNIYGNASGAQSAFAGTACRTNLAVRGPTSALQLEAVNYTGWNKNKCMTYTGYVWNRGATDVTWTFASALEGGTVAVKIDGVTVLDAAATTLTSANVTLTPGPHAFEYRAYTGDTVAKPYAPTGWLSKFGFVYDPQGRNDTSTPENFLHGMDPGDGTLFTRATNVTERLPVFGEMSFAVGTSLDVNGNAYVAANVTGWPTVTNSATDASAAPSFAITNRFVVNGADVAADRMMTVDVPFSFGDTGAVLVTNLENTAHATYMIVKTTADTPISFTGTTPLRQRLTTDSRKWFVYLSEDGKSIQLEYRDGFMVILR